MDTIEPDERDCLSDSHRDFMARYIQAEVRIKEKVAEKLLRQRSISRDASK